MAGLTALALFTLMLNRVPTAAAAYSRAPKILWDAGCTHLNKPGLQSFSEIGAACGSHLPACGQGLLESNGLGPKWFGWLRVHSEL